MILLQLQVFKTPWELQQWATDQAIAQGDIEIIIQADRVWYLFYWATVR